MAWVADGAANPPAWVADAVLMRRYGWTPVQVEALPPLWRERLLLWESFEGQASRERMRRERARAKR